MPSEWKVVSQYINGSQFYAVFRLKNKNGIDIPGNREYFTGFMPSFCQCE